METFSYETSRPLDRWVGHETEWRTGDFTLTLSSDPAVNGVNFTKNVSGQFGFRLDAGSGAEQHVLRLGLDGADRLAAVGQGFTITEADYQTTAGAGFWSARCPRSCPSPRAWCCWRSVPRA